MKRDFRVRVFVAVVLAVLFRIVAHGQSEGKLAQSAAEEVSGSGCVAAGVEAGCLVVKDSKTSRLYNVFFSAHKPAIGTAIEFTGTVHHGPTICMQGQAVNVKKWSPSKEKCSPAAHLSRIKGLQEISLDYLRITITSVDLMRADAI